ncbi:MAG: SGNH/GDSL hydrolase family protein, partial [Akkermansiaceae bacterium]
MRKTYKLIIAGILLLGMQAAMVRAEVAPKPPDLTAGGKGTEGVVTRLYVFGDSYSDSGAGYVDGNGPTAVVYLARRLGLELIPAPEAGDAARSLNFAVSGAQTGSGAGRKIKDALLGRGMMDQVDDFVGRVKAGSVAFDPTTTLFFLAGGLNDGNVPGAETVANLQN